MPSLTNCTCYDTWFMQHTMVNLRSPVADTLPEFRQEHLSCREGGRVVLQAIDEGTSE